MVDFKKKLGLRSIEKKVNPVEIYDELDRRSETGPTSPSTKRGADKLVVTSQRR